MFVTLFIIFSLIIGAACIVAIRFRPQAVDYWKRAEDMLKGWQKNDETAWEIEFKRQQGLHEIVIEKTVLIEGKKSIYWECACGYSAVSGDTSIVKNLFEVHVNTAKFFKNN